MTQAGRLRYLDGVRGIAVLAVLAQHLLEIVGIGGGSSLNLGRFGVILFFLLSGFVIPFSFSGERPLRRFAITRALRLYPAYWASLLAAAFLVEMTPQGFLANVTMIQGAFGYGNAVGAYWSLYYELIFYGLCAALFAIGMPTRAIGSLAIAFLIMSIDREWPMFLSFMLAGTLIRSAWHEHQEGAALWATALLALLVGRSLMLMHADALDIGTGAIAAVVVFLSAVRLKPRSAIAEWLGKISYSIYLFHGIVILAMPPLWAPAYVFTAVVLTLVVAELSFRFIEAPAIGIGKRITNFWQTSIAVSHKSSSNSITINR